MKLVFISSNQNKLREVRSLLPATVELSTLSDLEADTDIPETADTLEGNAKLKAAYIWDKYKLNALADDTGLEVDALKGAPGVYSARYAGEPSDSERNMSKLLKKLDGVENRKARFRTVLCFILDGDLHYFEGKVEGEIAHKKTGEKGFGYDPVFIPQGHRRSFAEMSLEEKNSMSHRGRALEKFVEFFNNL